MNPTLETAEKTGRRTRRVGPVFPVPENLPCLLFLAEKACYGPVMEQIAFAPVIAPVLPFESWATSPPRVSGGAKHELGCYASGRTGLDAGSGGMSVA